MNSINSASNHTIRLLGVRELEEKMQRYENGKWPRQISCSVGHYCPNRAEYRLSWLYTSKRLGRNIYQERDICSLHAQKHLENASEPYLAG